jgi:hypothetical protein
MSMAAEKTKDISKIFAEGKLIDRALRQAVREALRRHKEAGLPIVVWRRGKVVLVPPEKIPVGAGLRNRKKGR